MGEVGAGREKENVGTVVRKKNMGIYSVILLRGFPEKVKTPSI